MGAGERGKRGLKIGMERDLTDIIAISIGLGSFVWAAIVCFWISRLLLIRPVLSVPLMLVPAAISALMFAIFVDPSLSPSWWGRDQTLIYMITGLLVPFPILMTLMIAPVRRLRAGLPKQVEEVFQ